MYEMDWAKWALAYLRQARDAIHDEFNGVMGETKGVPFRGPQPAWFSASKGVIHTLYHYSQEFTADIDIPGSLYASPAAFDRELLDYRALVAHMEEQLIAARTAFESEHGSGTAPDIVHHAQRMVRKIADSMDHVLKRRPSAALDATDDHDLGLIVRLARRFHESVLALNKHPHGGTTLAIKDEWHCQYLLRSILAAYVREVRTEEWNPSNAGSSARCEFFLNRLRTMIELKYVREAADQKKIKAGLALDFVDYGGNPSVDHLICLVYDPNHQLPDPVALEDDLSKPTNGLKSVTVIVCPPRS